MTVTLDDKLTWRAIDYALNAVGNAQAKISNHRVGACVIAHRFKAFNTKSIDNNKVDFFIGCNIELATSMVYHAERVALVKAISEGFPYIDTCVVTSTHQDQQAAMCGYCMQDFMYANPDCRIIVVNMNKSIKVDTTVRERNGKYAYLGRGKLEI